MAKAVYKYEMPAPGEACLVKTHYGFSPKHLAIQHGTICLWAEVVANDPRRTARVFRTVPTGQSVALDETYIGTVLDLKGALVWHVYESDLSLLGKERPNDL